MIWIFRNICVLLLAWLYDIMGIIHENLFRKIKNKKIKLFNYWKKVKSYPIKLWSKGLKILKQAPRKKKKSLKASQKWFLLDQGLEKMVNLYTLILHIGSVAWILLRNVFSSDGEKQRVGYLNKQSRINMETECLYIFKTKDATEITNYYY